MSLPTESLDGLQKVSEWVHAQLHSRLRWPLSLAAPAALILIGLAGFLLLNSPFSSQASHTRHPPALPSRPSIGTEVSADTSFLRADTWPLFIGYTWGWTMLQQTLEALAATGWPGIVIVDNSRQKDALKQERFLREKYNITMVVETPAFLSFTQIQSMFAHLASKWQKKWYFWAHSDAYLLANVSDPYKVAVQCVLDRKRAHPKASVVFFQYDYISALETDTVLNKVPWDPYIQHYYADCDLYGRMLINGRTLEHCSIGNIFNMPLLLDPGTADKIKRGNLTHHQKVELVDGLIKSWALRGGDYAWRNHAADSTSKKSEADKHGFQLHQEASRQYYFKKYGQGAPCGWRDVRQQPQFDITDTRSRITRWASQQPEAEPAQPGARRLSPEQLQEILKQLQAKHLAVMASLNAPGATAGVTAGAPPAAGDKGAAAHEGPSVKVPG